MIKIRLMVGACALIAGTVAITAAGDEPFDRYLALAGEGKQPAMAEIHAFPEVFEKLGDENLGRRVENAYAELIYFNDTLVTLSHRDQLVEYLEDAQEKANYIRTEILDVATSDEDVYVRWRLDMSFDVLGKSKVSTTFGMSHLRFDEDGRIILHQDFWDSAAGFYRHIPIVGTMISWVQGRLNP